MGKISYEEAIAEDVEFSPEDAQPAGDAFAYGMVQGALLDFGDEAGSAVDAALSSEEDYAAALKRNRDNIERAYEKHPWLFTTGQLVGGAAFGLGLVKMGLSLSAKAARNAAPLLQRLGLASVEGAGIGAVQGAGAGEGLEDRAKGAAIGGAVGSVAGPALEGAGSAVQALMPGAKPGQQAAAQQAVDEAERVGIPLTRGQATGDVAQQQFEQEALHGGRGVAAQHVIGAGKEAQDASLISAKEAMGDRLGGGVDIRNPSEAGGEVVDALKRGTQAVKAEGKRLYDAAKAKDLRISTDALTGLKKSIDDALGEYDPLISEKLTPLAWSVRKRINAFTDLNRIEGGDPVAVSLTGLDSVRKLLTNARPQRGSQDEMIISQMRRSFDGWLENAVDTRLFSGDPQALSDLKRARGLWSQYLGITRPKTGDDAGQVIAKMATKDIDAVEATNFLLGANNIGAGGRPVRVIKRMKELFGEDSPEIRKLRQAMWLRLTMAPEGGNMPGPQKVSQQLSEFLGGKGGDLAKELFTPEQIRAMREFQRTARRLVPNERATNPPKSGYVVKRSLAAAWTTAMSTIGFAGATSGSGTLTAAAVAGLGGSLIRQGFNAARASRAVNKPVPKEVRPGGFGAYTGTIADDISEGLQESPPRQIAK